MDFQELRDSFLSSPDRTPRNPRFWCAEEKVMLYWDTVSQSAWNRWPEHNPSGKGYGLMYLMFSDTSKYARLESSGIRDRLWKEIFEGDVVSHPEHWSGKRKYSLVSRKSSGFFFPFGDGDYSVLLPSDITVVGNVLESPELAGKFSRGEVRTGNEEPEGELGADGKSEDPLKTVIN